MESGDGDMDERDERDAWRLRRLEWSLQALAAPASSQLELFPALACKADELALDFDDARLVAVDGLASRYSPDELRALVELDAKLRAMSRSGPDFSEDLWTDRALAADVHWAEVRALAARALAALGWPARLPPSDPRERGTRYVR